MCEGAPTHGRRLKKNNFVENVLSVCLNMMCEHGEDPGWETREEIDHDDDDDDTTNRGMGEEALARLAEVRSGQWLCVCGCGCLCSWLLFVDARFLALLHASAFERKPFCQCCFQWWASSCSLPTGGIGLQD